MAENSEDLRYPIGKLKFEGPATFAQREHWIREIEEAPRRLRKAVEGLSDARLDTPYREGGWTVRQVVHHLADSHMNACVRIRLALTEADPPVKVYDQTLWAELIDARRAPVELSLALLEGLHARLTSLLRSLEAKDFERAMMHPERGRVTLDNNLAIYAWHGRHHVAHITSLGERMGWK